MVSGKSHPTSLFLKLIDGLVLTSRKWKSKIILNSYDEHVGTAKHFVFLVCVKPFYFCSEFCYLRDVLDLLSFTCF